MGLIVDIEFATYEVASFLTVIYYVYRVNKMRKTEYDERLRKEIEYVVDKTINDKITKIIQQVVLSDEFEKKIKETITMALNESQQMKMLDQIIIVLCTYVPELKKSKLCNP